MKTAHAIDSHTEGEPTRVIVQGGPTLEGTSVGEKARRLAADHDAFRRAVVCEPRGYDALVGALLVEPCDAEAEYGVIFFNNVGLLGMCGHGLIGTVRTLAYLDRIGPGEHRFETPAGLVRAVLHDDGSVSVFNVKSYRSAKQIEVDVDGYGRIRGDVAYGGNWFFLTEEPKIPIRLASLGELTDCSTKIRRALRENCFCGDRGEEIDHVEIFGPPDRDDADSKNFVLCPGLAYDRSPCGTGTSAKLACLAADGKLAPGARWGQESLIGTLFEARYEPAEGGVHPQIRGSAFVTGRIELIFEPGDPLKDGIST